jgi:Ca-activated chloride channel homolog
MMKSMCHHPACSFFVLALFCAAVYGQQSSPDVLRVQTRLVEVYATVYDSSGHYVDGLGRDRFHLLEDGRPQPIAIFETNIEKLSCAVVLDTTGSMATVLPRVKNAVVKLIDALGPQDAVAIYTFDRQLTLRQDFTIDKMSAKRAVLRLRAEGETALFDSISQAAQEVGAQPGKKAMIVFTDGDDNASMLNAGAAVNRAKKLGIPLYTIAEGEALQAPQLKRLLKELSEATGAMSYEVKKNGDIEQVFQDISRDLQHLYLISYRPPPGPGAGKWRKIELSVIGSRDYRIRTKQGYVIE